MPMRGCSSAATGYSASATSFPRRFCLRSRGSCWPIPRSSAGPGRCSAPPRRCRPSPPRCCCATPHRAACGRYATVIMAAGVAAPVVASSVGMLLVAAICIGGTFMVPDDGRYAGGAARRGERRAALDGCDDGCVRPGPAARSRRGERPVVERESASRGEHCRCRPADRWCGDPDRVAPSA